MTQQQQLTGWHTNTFGYTKNISQECFEWWAKNNKQKKNKTKRNEKRKMIVETATTNGTKSNTYQATEHILRWGKSNWKKKNMKNLFFKKRTKIKMRKHGTNVIYPNMIHCSLISANVQQRTIMNKYAWFGLASSKTILSVAHRQYIIIMIIIFFLFSLFDLHYFVCTAHTHTLITHQFI